MRRRRRNVEAFSLSFLDCICCGFGAIILLLVLSKIYEPVIIEKTQDDLTKTTIYAPLTGRVIALSAEEGEVVVSGTMNNPASIIGIIADLSEILAEVDVDETEVAYLEIGQSATLTVDALADRVYEGKVVEIGSSGFSRPQQPDVTFFKVKVLLDEPDADLRAGMSVRAEIVTAEHEEALVVPIQVVVERLPLDDEGEEVDAALARLSQRQRQVIELVLLRDFTVGEAAYAMGVSRGAASRHYAIAKERVRAALGAEGAADD